MAELKVLEKKRRDLEKLVSARNVQGDALRDRVITAEADKTKAEAAMQKAVEADDMISYAAAKEDRDAAQDLINFCQERIAAIEVPYDPAVCNAAVAAVEKEYAEIVHNGNVKLARLIDEILATCEEMLAARDARKGFSSWVNNDLLRQEPRIENNFELQEISMLQSAMKTKRDNADFYKDGKRK